MNGPEVVLPPKVAVDLEIHAQVSRVWETVLDVASYSDSMTSVRWVKLLHDSPTTRRTGWSVILKGSILEWEEEEHLDHDAHVIRFHQLNGDLDLFDGQWVIEERGPKLCRVRFEAIFEIGIPLLAEMLNPVAKRSLTDNCIEMLRGIEQTAVEA